MICWQNPDQKIMCQGNGLLPKYTRPQFQGRCCTDKFPKIFICELESVLFNIGPGR